MAAMQLDCPRVDSTATAAIRAVERDERPARLTHTMYEAFQISFGREPVFMGRRLAQDIYRWTQGEG